MTPAGQAEASHGLHPRTPVVWSDTACMTIVDRSITTLYQLEYDIPFEDTDVPLDEVPDSRTHQFIATCQQFSWPEAPMPGWISQSDVDTAVEFGLVDEGSVPPAAILELNEDFSGCWHRINDDSDRRPITNEMAEKPVPWETAEVPVGTYYIWGYTHEPPFNLWTPREGGVIKIINGGDPGTVGPGGAITTTGQTVCVGQVVPIEGCVDALPGSSLSSFYAIYSSQDSELAWNPIVEDLPINGTSFSIEWIPPNEVGKEQVFIRVDFSDPMGRTYTAYQAELHVVLAADNLFCDFDPDEDCDSAFLVDPRCEMMTGGTTGSIEPWSTSTDGSADADRSENPSNGCTCTATLDGRHSTLRWLVLLSLIARPRRRSSKGVLLRGHRPQV